MPSLLLALTRLLAALVLLGGAFTRVAALALATLTLVPGLAVPGPGEPQQVLALAWLLLLGGGLVLLAAHGPGDFSFDAWRGARAGKAADLSSMYPGGAL